MNFALLPPDEVRAAAKSLIQKIETVRSWVDVASLLGAVEDRTLYADFGFASTRAWADEELGFDSQDTALHLRLYRMVQSSRVPPDQWRGISKGKARIVARAIGLGGEPAVWIGRAAEVASEEVLREMLTRMTGGEVFVEWSCRLPDSLVPLLDEALCRALRELETVEVPEDPASQRVLIQVNDIRFRCLEVLAKTYLEITPSR